MLQSKPAVTANRLFAQPYPVSPASRRVGMQAMFDENWERIRPLIDECVSDKNPYDIDQFCQEQSVVFPEKFLKKNQLDVLKADAYREGLTLTSYMRVIAVLSRDRYLEIHGMNK